MALNEESNPSEPLPGPAITLGLDGLCDVKEAHGEVRTYRELLAAAASAPFVRCGGATYIALS